MPLPFDATLKQLVRDHPNDWAAILKAPTELVEFLTPDLATVTRFADVVLRVGGEGILHIEFQTGPDPTHASRMLLYNVLLYHEYELPVHSTARLLRPEAGIAGWRGAVNYHLFPRRGRLEFRCEVFRVWQRPATEFLAGGLGIAPLAVLGQLAGRVPRREAASQVVAALVERVTQDAEPTDAATLIASAFILTGLRFPKGLAVDLFRGVHAMRESSTYQAILDEGRVEAFQKTLFRQGQRRFGAADSASEAKLKGITDPDRLERMTERLLDVESWSDLLATR